MPPDIFLVGYADDIAAVIVAPNTDDAQKILNEVKRRVGFWLEEHYLDLATENTEIVLLTRGRTPTIIQLYSRN